jgi:hypothetical protein
MWARLYRSGRLAVSPEDAPITGDGKSCDSGF